MDGASFFKTLLQSNSTNAPIQFNGSDETNSFPVSGTEVNIVTSDGNHDLGSSKLKIKNIVNFGWDHKYSHGQLVAVHVTGTYLAYAITTPGNNLGVVRVVNRSTNDRILVKGMRGPVKDLSFAHIATEVIVGCVDVLGNLFVHRVTEQSSGLASERLLEVLRDGSETGLEHRLIWCPYLPEPTNEEEEDEEEPDTSAARLLVLTHGTNAEVWSVDLVVDAHGSGPLTPEGVTQGVLQVTTTSGGVIIDAAFSPDGSALATASEGGEVNFFQIYFHEDGPPRCLHNWNPHNGNPVSSLYFLDDHSSYQPDVHYWKFAVTGCDYNSKLKVWSCESWKCLQTLSIKRAEQDDIPVRLKSALDPTARYLLLADIDRCLIYVLSLAQGENGARVVSISEFATPAAFLSFCCVSAGRRLVRQTTEGVHVSNEEDDVLTGKERTVVRIYLVQPKSLQECSIIFEDAAKVGNALKLDQTPELNVSLQDQSFSSSGTDKGTSLLELLEDNPSPMRPESQSTPRMGSPSSKLSSIPAPSIPLPTSLPSHTMPPPSLPVLSASHSLPPPDTSGLPLPPLSLARPASNADQLAEAASKISLLSPEQFKVPPPATKIKPDLIVEGNGCRVPLPLEQEEDYSQPDSEEEVAPPKLECVARKEETVSESGNSSPSREVRDILSVDEPVYDGQVRPSESPDRTFQESMSPSPAIPSKFPTPPEVPLPTTSTSQMTTNAGDSTDLTQMLRNLQLQMQEEREVQAAAMARLERRLEAVLSRDPGETLGKRLEGCVAHKIDVGMKQQTMRLEVGKKEQTENLLVSLSSSLGGRLDQVVTGELKRGLPPAVSRAMDGIQSGLEREVGTKLQGLEQQIIGGFNEVITQSVSSPQTREIMARTVAQAISSSLQASITESYRVAFQQQALGFERAMQTMLRQVAEQFNAGTREYEMALNRKMEAKTEKKEKLAPVLSGLETQINEVKENVARLGQSLGELARHLENSRSSVSGEEVREIVRKELQTALNNSRSVTDTPQPDHKSHNMRQIIQAHIQAGRIEAAFQTALSANDLQLVVFTCELLNTTQVFNSATCPLSQSVLLSLIHQLSIDLNDKTEVKHAYLHEALVNLDPNNPTTKGHINAVLAALETALRQYIQANPNSKMTRNMKLLVMACGTQQMH